MLAGAWAFAVAASAATRYVVPAGTEGNVPTSPYTSWETAANEVADAVGVSENGDIVLVQKGTYAVGEQILLHQKLTIRSYDPESGGICRDGTVLDGSTLAAADPQGLFCARGASMSTSDITIDGFTIRNSPIGGLNAQSVTRFQVLNCDFLGNTAPKQGGGIRFYAVNNAVISNCTFVGNQVPQENNKGTGGGIYLIANGYEMQYASEIVDCVFSNNTGNAGTAVNSARATFVKRCLFKDNVNDAVQYNSGTLVLGRYGHVSDCTFTGVATGEYGQCLSIGDSEGGNSVSNCTFTGLSAEGPYGVVKCSGGTVIANCVFTNNAKTGTALVFALQNAKDVVVRNCLLTVPDGSSTYVLRTHGSQAIQRIENCTLFAPRTTLASASNGTCTNLWKNCILFGTMPESTAARTQVVENCYTGTNPGFVSPVGNDCRLRSDSPCVDTGVALDWHAEATDLRGGNRVVGAAVDLGCYERQTDDSDVSGVVRLVAGEADRKDDWADAFTDPQAAIDATPDGGVLLVRTGTYAIGETLVVSNRALTIRSADPATGEPDPERTVFDGGKARRILFVHWGAEVKTNTSDPWPCTTDFNPAYWRPVRIEGLTFKDGLSATDDGSFNAGQGGGLLLYGRAPDAGMEPSAVVNCRFTGCAAANGGGAAIWGGLLTNCVFAENTATNAGGGVISIMPYTRKSAETVCYDLSRTWYVPAIVGCSFTNNLAYADSGAFGAGLTQNECAYVADCTFVDNHLTRANGNAAGNGSALGRIRCSLVTNCVFVGNSGAAYGSVSVGAQARLCDLTLQKNSGNYGVIFGNEKEIFIENCRWTSNSNWCYLGAATFRNCLMANTDSSQGVFQQYGSVPTVFENCTLCNTRETPLSYHGSSANNDVSLKNCIVWRSDGKQVFWPSATVHAKADTIITCVDCCFSAEPDAQYAGHFNLTRTFFAADPGFADAANDDWSLKRRSVCRDKGSLLDWMDVSSRDVAGNLRVMKDGVSLARDPTALPDLGCYENQDEVPGSLLIFR